MSLLSVLTWRVCTCSRPTPCSKEACQWSSNSISFPALCGRFKPLIKGFSSSKLSPRSCPAGPVDAPYSGWMIACKQRAASAKSSSAERKSALSHLHSWLSQRGSTMAPHSHHTSLAEDMQCTWISDPSSISARHNRDIAKGSFPVRQEISVVAARSVPPARTGFCRLHIKHIKA